VTALWQGAEMSAYTPLDASAFEVTTAGTFDSSAPLKNRCSIGIHQAFSGVETEHWGNQSTLFYHTTYAFNGVTFFFSNPAISLFAEAGTEVFRLRVTDIVDAGSFATFEASTLQSGVLTAVGTFDVGSYGALNRFDIKLVGNSASGSVEVYMQEALKVGASGLNHSGFAGASFARLRGSPVPGGVAFVSEGIADTTSTIGQRLGVRHPTGNSAANLGWGAADFSNVDETVFTDTDVMSASAANDVRTFTYTDNDFTGFDILKVGVERREKAGASGPQNDQAVVRIGGTNFFSATKALNAGYGGKVSVFENDPSTAVAWVDPPTEFGLKSIT
jgi:hypothetical protein